MEKILKGLQFNMSFAPISDIRERVFKREDEFRRYFRNGFSVAALPPNAPAEIPLFFAVDEAKKLTCTISGRNIHLAQRQEGKFSLDIDSFVDLSIQICKVFREIVSLQKIEFSGITGTVWLNVGDGTAFLKNNFLGVKSMEVFDAAVRMTQVVNDIYYVNFSCNNLRASRENNEIVSFELDVNDRYRYNFGSSSEEQDFEKTIKDLKLLLLKEYEKLDDWTKE